MSQVDRLISLGIELEDRERRAEEERARERARKRKIEEDALRESALATIRAKLGSLWGELEPYATFDVRLPNGLVAVMISGHPKLSDIRLCYHDGILSATGGTYNGMCSFDKDSIARFILSCHRAKADEQ